MVADDTTAIEMLPRDVVMKHFDSPSSACCVEISCMHMMHQLLLGGQEHVLHLHDHIGVSSP